MTVLESNLACSICSRPIPANFLPYLAPEIPGSPDYRTMCRDCWSSIIDLSICWVCGECVLRGEEVVSLGWCFWHKHCFGCLTCGERIFNLRDEDRTETAAEDSRFGFHNSKCHGTVELKEAPLCHQCTSELRNFGMGHLDGPGEEVIPRRRRRRHRKIKGASDIESELERFINQSSDTDGLGAPQASEASIHDRRISNSVPTAQDHSKFPEKFDKTSKPILEPVNKSEHSATHTHDTLYKPPPSTPTQTSSTTKPIIVPSQNRRAKYRVSFPDSDDINFNSNPTRALTLGPLHDLFPGEAHRAKLDRNPTPFPRMAKSFGSQSHEHDDICPEYFNRSVTSERNQNFDGHKDMTRSDVLTLKEFSEMTDSLRRTKLGPARRMASRMTLLETAESDEGADS